MKPYGLTVGLQVTKPTRAMDMIWDAIEQAIDEGMTVRQVKIEMQQAWESAFNQKAKEGKEFVY